MSKLIKGGIESRCEIEYLLNGFRIDLAVFLAIAPFVLSHR